MRGWRMWWARLALTLAALGGWGVAQALPNVDEVQAVVKQGDYAKAEQMMREVVAAHPNSARAHYVLAEILAHERQFAAAADHARRARTLDPAIKFTDPARFTAFEQLLERQQAASLSAAPALQGAPAPVVQPAPRPLSPPAPSSGVPVWLLVVGAVVFIALAVRWMARRAAPVAASQPAYAGQAGYGAGAWGAGPAAAPPSGGPGLMGVGLAAAGGVAAGMLAERLLHGDHDEHRRARERDVDSGAGGIIPGSFDTSRSSAGDELSSRAIDFGSGDGWDSGGGGDSSDGGGGGDSW